MTISNKKIVSAVGVSAVLVIVFGFVAPFLISARSDLGVGLGVVLILGVLTYGLTRAVKALK